MSSGRTNAAASGGGNDNAVRGQLFIDSGGGQTTITLPCDVSDKDWYVVLGNSNQVQSMISVPMCLLAVYGHGTELENIGFLTKYDSTGTLVGGRAGSFLSVNVVDGQTQISSSASWYWAGNQYYSYCVK